LSLSELTVDQGLYSASNFALAALAGRSLDTEGFGRFALVALVGALVVALVRAVWHEPDLALAASAGTGAVPGPGRCRARGDGTGQGTATPAATLVVVTAALVAILVPVTSLRSGPGPVVGLGAAAILATLVQDAARYRAIAAGRSVTLVAGDAAWLVVVAAALAAAGDGLDLAGVLTMWLAGAAAGIGPHVLGPRLLDPGGPTAPSGPVPADHRPQIPTDQASRNRRIALLADFLLLTGMTQLGGLLLGAVLPLDQFAALRGAITVFGPVGVLVAAVSTWVFAAAQAGCPDPAPIGRRAMGVAGVALAVVALVAVVPTPVGVTVLGSGWPPRSVLVLIGLSVTGQALSWPGFSLLRLVDARRLLLSLRATGLIVFLTATMTLAAVSQRAAITAAGYAAVNLSLAVVVWVVLLGCGRSGHRPAPGQAAGDGQDQQARASQGGGPVPVQR
jgi:hypothetical protein